MAFSLKTRLPRHMTSLCLLLFFILILSLPLSIHSSSIHELLKSMGLPAGLLPKEVKSYKISGSGLLEVFLDGPCLTKFDTMALYESEVRANLTYGSLTGVEGMLQEELFLWLPVKDIVVNDPTSGLILFDIGVYCRTMPEMARHAFAASRSTTVKIITSALF